MGVRIERAADHHVRPDDLAHALEKVALAIVIAVGDHRAVHPEQHHVDRQRGTQIRQQRIPQPLKGRAREDLLRETLRSDKFHYETACRFPLPHLRGMCRGNPTAARNGKMGRISGTGRSIDS